jgi:hypothetical protein
LSCPVRFIPSRLRCVVSGEKWMRHDLSNRCRTPGQVVATSLITSRASVHLPWSSGPHGSLERRTALPQPAAVSGPVGTRLPGQTTIILVRFIGAPYFVLCTAQHLCAHALAPVNNEPNQSSGDLLALHCAAGTGVAITRIDLNYLTLAFPQLQPAPFLYLTK